MSEDVACIEGGCHCRAVRFEVHLNAAEDLDENGRLRITECNCTICAATGYLHWIVPRERFTLLCGAEAMREYRFGSRAARHLFCGTCGVKSYYVPRSHPDGISVNLRCIDLEGLFQHVDGTSIELFDGQNWERNIDQLKTRSSRA